MLSTSTTNNTDGDICRAASTTWRSPPCRSNMVFLDEDGVIQPVAVIPRATASHGIFLGVAKPGDGLSRIQDRRSGSRDGVHVPAGSRRRRRQGLEEVQCGPLAGKKRRGGTLQAANVGSRRDGFSVGAVPTYPDIAVELAEHFIKPGCSAENASFPGVHPCSAGGIRRDQVGRQIARADVLTKRLRHGLRDRLGGDGRGRHSGSLTRNTKKPGKAVRLPGLGIPFGYAIR